ncbi:STAS/SEC14 domain-containing protein [Pseudobdellovibrio exovorus]|uniref:STAS/SEC14 domain-containing protein n=1 Tax=Pseudobdellovibrio exovorus JSS TaxID=1184267 RepID=M4V983_9BACT|nr:STAS/SEC14 domain-containing protein [Pseudobdellovibrio exovorus]AGH94576.1 hypothetical protein A11Q_356 [Pseudobdellovibrio exovorus JSS]
MVEILGSPKDVVALRVTQTLDADDYQEIIEEIEFRLVTHQKVSIYADLLDLNHVTAQAVAKRIAYSIAKIGEWHRFPRVALLTEKSWMSAMSKISSALIPRVQIKTFDRASKDEALRWAYGVTSPSVEMPSHSVTS